MSKITDSTLANTARVMLLAFGLHAAHEIQLPPCRRQEHVPENEPVLPGDIGFNLVMVTNTTTGMSYRIGPMGFVKTTPY